MTKYSSNTAKIGALIIAWELAVKNTKSENLQKEINAAFQRTMFDLLPYKLIGVVHESGIARMGIFQSTDDLYEWLKPQRKKGVVIEEGNGYNLGYKYSKKFNVDLNQVKSYKISDDLSSVVYTIEE